MQRRPNLTLVPLRLSLIAAASSAAVVSACGAGFGTCHRRRLRAAAADGILHRRRYARRRGDVPDVALRAGCGCSIASPAGASGLAIRRALPPLIGSSICFAVLIVLLLAGLFGTRDPLENPLPLAVWTLLWGGLTIPQALLGDIWATINPWIAPYRLMLRLLGRSPDDEPHCCAYPAWLGYWPAMFGFLAFGWFELVDPAAGDPARLAFAVVIYTASTLVGMLVFGDQSWLVQSRMLLGLSRLRCAALAALQKSRAADLGVWFFRARPWRDPSALPFSGIVFVLLTLSTVSFDGLSKTFWWLDLGGINPLDFPGRRAVMSDRTASAFWPCG